MLGKATVESFDTDEIGPREKSSWPDPRAPRRHNHRSARRTGEATSEELAARPGTGQSTETKRLAALEAAGATGSQSDGR